MAGAINDGRAERPVEIMQLPARLHALFDGKVPASKSADAAERERNFLSRALAGFALTNLGGATADQAAIYLVDGSRDGGIDAVYFDPTTETLWVVQSKWIDDGRGQPDLGGVSKFRDGVHSLLENDFEVFAENPDWAAILPAMNSWFERPNLRVRAALVYSGTACLEDDRARLLERLRADWSRDDALFFDTVICDLAVIHNWCAGAPDAIGVDGVKLLFHFPGMVNEPVKMMYGLVSLRELAELHHIHGPALVTANIRGYKGATDVNDQIRASIEDDPATFVFLNNGLTAYCRSLSIANKDKASVDSKQVTADGFSVVNGAQTLGSVAKAAGGQLPQSGYAFVKLISPAGRDDQRAFAQRITRSTNFQNQVTARDFAALHPRQETLARQLAGTPVTYHYKDSEGVPPGDDTNFAIDEAITAGACLEQNEAADMCARVRGNRPSLWSLEPDHADPDRPRTRFERIFRADRSARALWRAVQTQRIVSREVSALATSESGVRKECFINARWLVLSLVFLKVRPQLGEELAIDADTQALIAQRAVEYAETVFDQCVTKNYIAATIQPGGTTTYAITLRTLPAVFSSSGDCQILRNGVLAALAA